MPDFIPTDPDFESRVRASFERQQLLKPARARLVLVRPGEVHIELPFDESLAQQDGYLHAGMVTAIVDTACGYAAYTLMPADSGVLSVEFKVNFLAPAQGERFMAVGKVIKPGRTLTVCSGEVLAMDRGEMRLVAVMQATMIRVSKAPAS